MKDRAERESQLVDAIAEAGETGMTAAQWRAAGYGIGMSSENSLAIRDSLEARGVITVTPEGRRLVIRFDAL